MSAGNHNPDRELDVAPGLDPGLAPRLASDPDPRPGHARPDTAGTGRPPNALNLPNPLRADCENCFALCCVALWLSASADFAITKPAGRPCPNLQTDNRCSIHTRLRTSGFGGCATYDCFGAGQQVSQVTFGGRDWRGDPAVAEQMFAVFPIMRTLHELRWYLTEALTLPAAAPIHGRLRAALTRTEQMADADARAIPDLDVPAHRDTVNALLRQASDLARATMPGPRKDHRGADLIGARLSGADLRGASLRGALLMGADLRTADLGGADVTGANFSGANLAGTDLSTTLFLHQTQLDAALGDPRTRLPDTLTRPGHWATTATATVTTTAVAKPPPRNRPQRPQRRRPGR